MRRRRYCTKKGWLQRYEQPIKLVFLFLGVVIMVWDTSSTRKFLKFDMPNAMRDLNTNITVVTNRSSPFRSASKRSASSGKLEKGTTPIITSTKKNDATATNNSKEEEHTAIIKYHEWGPEGIDINGLIGFFYDRIFDYWGYRSEQHFRTLSRASGRYEYRRLNAAYVGVLGLRKSDRVPRIYLASRVVSETALKGGRIKNDVLPELQKALSDLLPTSRTKYPALIRALERGTIPLVLQTSDWKQCPHNSYEYDHHLTLGNVVGPSGEAQPDPWPTSAEEGNQRRWAGSVPRFSFSHVLNCGYNFPLPDYNIIGLAKKRTELETERSKYPWPSKLQKAVWRGQITHPERTTMLDRYGHDKELFDMADTGNTSNYMRMEDMMNYRAVIDIDGHAWTDRFHSLLCFNSVVIKIQIDATSYFTKAIQPGVHYIPASLDNLTQVVQYATSNENEGQVQSIISNANAWCQKHVSEQSLRGDMLSLLNGYAEELDRANPEWSKVWNQHAQIFLGSTAFNQTGPWIDAIPHRSWFNQHLNQAKFEEVDFLVSG